MVPAFGLLVAFFLDDLVAGRDRLHPVFAAIGVAIVLLVCRDLMHEPERWIEMFVYRYDRPWPAAEPYAIDPSDGVLGLLTGNLERGAELKLLHYGVWHYFEFGAYADDHYDRNQLGHFARARAARRHGIEFPPERIFVLGDTPHDVTCARAIGAKAIAIATGRFSRTELAPQRIQQPSDASHMQVDLYCGMPGHHLAHERADAQLVWIQHGHAQAQPAGDLAAKGLCRMHEVPE